MKVAIASQGKNEKSLISLVGGRAPYYLIFKDKKLIKAIKNPFRFGGGGAGFGMAEMLADENVALVISGKIGDRMAGALESKGIRYEEFPEVSVNEALERIEL